MKVVLAYGAALGGLVFVWQLVSAALLPGTPLFIPIATGLEVGTLISLFSRPAVGRPIGPRILGGAGVSLIGALFAFAGSLLVTQVLFPDLLALLGPVPPTAIAAAGGGFMGTLVTGTAMSAALAVLQRNRTG